MPTVSKKKQSFFRVPNSLSFPAVFLVIAALFISSNAEQILLSTYDEYGSDASYAISVTPFDNVAGALIANNHGTGNTGTGNSQGNTGAGGGLQNPIKSNSLSEFLEQILDIVIQIGYLVAVFFIILSGFKFVTAQGNESEVTKAKTMLLWTVIGTAVLIGAHVISAAIQATVESIRS